MISFIVVETMIWVKVEISNIHGFGSFLFFSGGVQVKLCGIAQYGNLIGVTIGYTITASISIV